LTLNDSEFTSTDENGGAIVIEAGDFNVNGTTEGLHYGFSLLNEGDSATLYIPSVYGYKEQGTALVPPNTIIKYRIRFHEIDRLAMDNVKIDQYIVDMGFESEFEEDEVYGTRFIRHIKGNGSDIVLGSRASIYYIGQLLDGTEFDNNYDDYYPWELTVGVPGIITGFERGLVQLSSGDSATFFVPSTYAYQDMEVGDGAIPANSVLVFAVKVVDVVQGNY
jgi:FKBP-type peptidyl-prolyl cis-trans isomerase